MSSTRCDLCMQGQVRPLVTAAGTVVLMCDEDGTVWLRPEDVGTDRYVQPAGPSWEVGDGVNVVPGTTRWAKAEEVARLTDWDVSSLKGLD